MKFNTGVEFVDVPAESTIEVQQAVGVVLLKILGCEAWLVEVEAPKKKIKEAVVAPKKSLKKDK